MRKPGAIGPPGPFASDPLSSRSIPVSVPRLPARRRRCRRSTYHPARRSRCGRSLACLLYTSRIRLPRSSSSRSAGSVGRKSQLPGTCSRGMEGNLSWSRSPSRQQSPRCRIRSGEVCSTACSMGLTAPWESESTRIFIGISFPERSFGSV